MGASGKAAGIAVGCVALAACRGLLLPVDGGVDAGQDAGAPSDAAAPDADAAAAEASEVDGGVACDYDASDDALCTPPANDLLIATPPVVQIAAGSFGLATFEATGPWASDPTIYIRYESSTFVGIDVVQNESYGSPQSLQFMAPTLAAGLQGTITASARAGNIERRASVTVNVTTCKPWPPSMVCDGQECGMQGDGCGGLLRCGACSAPTGYCWVGHCVAAKPVPCPAGDGFDPDAGDGGACVPCSETPTCNPCPDPVTMPHQSGYCVAADSLCICYTQPKGMILPSINLDGSSPEQ